MASEWTRTAARMMRWSHQIHLTKVYESGNAHSWPTVTWPQGIYIRATVKEVSVNEWEWFVQLRVTNTLKGETKTGTTKRETGSKKAALRVVAEYVTKVRALPEVQAAEQAVIEKHVAMGYERPVEPAP